MRVIPERASWIRSEPIREGRTGLYWCLRKARDTIRFRCFSHSVMCENARLFRSMQKWDAERAHTLNHASERLY